MAKKEIEQNVIVTVFKVESEGYQALSELRQALADETYLVSAAALVKKEGELCTYLDGFDTGVNTRKGAMIGGLIGMTVGLLAGPLGVLFGASAGTLAGMTADMDESVFELSMLGQIADKLDDGMVAIVALASEENNEALDALLSKFETVIARFDAEAVADEVDKAYEAQAEMARQARAEVRKEEREKLREELEENEEIFRQGFRK